MCACPVATIRWALDRAGVASAAPTAWRAAATSGTRSRARGDVVQQPSPARVVELECAHQTVEDAEVVHERFGVRVDDDQVGALEPVQRLLTRCRRRSEGGWPELRERRVRGRLDREHEPSRLRVDGDVGALRMDPLDRLSGVVADETLALEPGGIAVEAEVDHGLDAAAGPVLRDLTGQAEPCRPPRRTPPRTDGEVGEPVERRPGLDPERYPIGLDERNDPLPPLARDASLHERAVVVHPRTLPNPRGTTPRNCLLQIAECVI